MRKWISGRKIKNLLLYGGLEREEFHELLPSLRERNQTYLRIYSSLAAGLFLVLTLAGLATRGFISVNVPVFALSFAVSCAILLSARRAMPRHPNWIPALVYGFELLLYVFALNVSLLHPDLTAVSAVAFLLVTPLLFLDRPLRLTVATALITLFFCVAVYAVKAPNVAEADCWNMGSYGAVGIGIGFFAMRVKLRNLSQERRIVFLSETDLLTGVKNRNCFEQRLGTYPPLCRRGLLCVYADVNGLHELNNTQGHQAGDQMLRRVAGELAAQYGAEHCYRVGGDEFVAFAADAEAEAAQQVLAGIRARLSACSYHVSFGVSYMPCPVNDPEALVRRAEAEMYRAKRAYYSDCAHSRGR